MIKVNLHQVKAQLSRYIEMVEAGETVVVCKRNVPVAEIRPLQQKKKKTPELGWADGTLRVSADFNELTAEEVIQWEGDEKDTASQVRAEEMKLLLDTVTFLDAAFSSNDISKRAKELLMHPDSELFISIASCWEIAIKYSIGRLALPDNPDRFVTKNRAKLGAEVLGLDEESVFQIPRLPDIHRDPFDRILICQAIIHGMILLTPDDRIARYPVRTAW